jgi:4-alpha-glucanotransferase
MDFLEEAGQAYWQMLPLHPTELRHRNSPYHSESAFAGNPLLISPELLLESGLLPEADLDDFAGPADRVDYARVEKWKQGLFRKCFEQFQGGYEFDAFCSENSHWLDDYSIFASLKRHYGLDSWADWPEEIKHRHPEALSDMQDRLGLETRYFKFLQYLYQKQWQRLRAYGRSKAISIIGDLPIYVHYESADVWSNPRIFKLDEGKKPVAAAGVPPDYFSETGQLWGNPVYDWQVLAQEGYGWWIKRLRRALELLDFVRIDHFRGLVAYWEVGAQETTAMNGRWREAPAMDFLKVLARQFPGLPVIAEDLGVITPEVREVIAHYDLPGMKVLLFAFGDEVASNPFAPHNHVRNCVVYTGTHDNNTVRGWFDQEALPEDKTRLFGYLGRSVAGEAIHWEMVRMAMGSVADTVIIPIQDVLGLGSEARMNRPGTTDGNWTWRLLDRQLTPELSLKLREVTEVFGRL